MTRWKAVGIARWCAWTAGFFLLASGGFRSSGISQDELECEQAAAHLKSCCPDFPVTDLRCDYVVGCGVNEAPVLAFQTSKCIERTPCSTLVANGSCEKLAELARTTRSAENSPDAGYEPVPQEGLCE